MNMIERLKKIIETQHQLILFIIILMTLIFSLFLPSVEFRTKIEDFYPENDAVKADRTIEDYFGKDPLLQYIYVSPRGEDPGALRREPDDFVAGDGRECRGSAPFTPARAGRHRA